MAQKEGFDSHLLCCRKESGANRFQLGYYLVNSSAQKELDWIIHPVLCKKHGDALDIGTMNANGQHLLLQETLFEKRTTHKIA